MIARWMVLVVAAAAGSAFAQAPNPARPGISFESADVQRLQADDFANPGMLWVAQGERHWRENAERGKPSCSACHGEAAVSMKGVAARYPRFDAGLGRVVNLGERIVACQRTHQGDPGSAPESAALLALSAFVARQSRGMPIAASAEGPAKATFEAGARLYRERIGQMNLACVHCHDANWGKTLLAEAISQGHPTDWPSYRLEWQSLGSLQRRLRACFFGVRAEQPAFGSPELVALELYLAARARGMAMDAPGVRR